MARLSIILTFVFFSSKLIGQNFLQELKLRGQNQHGVVKMMPDSSFISVTYVDYYNYNLNAFDTTCTLIIRYNKRGDILYYKTLPDSKTYSYVVRDILVQQDKIFLSGSLDYADSSYAFLMRLNNCIEVEKFSIFRFRGRTSIYFENFATYSDSQLLVTGIHFIQGDSSFITLFLMDKEFNLKWNTSYIGFQSEIEVVNYGIHLWGAGFYPLTYDSTLSEIKSNHLFVNRKGKVVYENVNHLHEDGVVSVNRKLQASEKESFLMGSYADIQGKNTNELIKMNLDGIVVKRTQLNNPNESEYPTALTRISDNRFVAIGVIRVNFDTMICNAYLVDSNLNILRKKRLVPSQSWMELNGSIKNGIRSNALLYGVCFDANSPKMAKGIMLELDTFLNLVQLPSIKGFTDSLCFAGKTDLLMLPSADTVWVEDLKLRDRLFLSTHNEAYNNALVELYPNPNNGKFMVHLNQATSGHVLIYNILGQLILEQEFKSSDSINIQLQDVANGLYFVAIKGDKISYHKGIVINR